MSLRKNNANSDTISDAFNYDLFVKKYVAGLDRINLKTQLQIANQKIESFAQQVDELKRANIELNEKLASVNTEEVKVRKKKA